MPYKPINEKTHSSTQKALPRMRTIPKAYKEIKETLIKSFVHIAQSDFLSGCTNKPQ